MYADFAGYSAIAIGLAMLLGYQLPINFNLPYISASFSEFWGRWHITLSKFLKEYLYIPLGGNRNGTFRTYLNLMIVMSLGGLWHGAAYSYLAWGGLHGAFLIGERYFLAKNNNISALVAGRASLAILVMMCRVAFVFTCVSFAWLFFKLPDFQAAMLYIKHMFSSINEFTKPQEFYLLCGIYSLPVILQHVGHICVRTRIFRHAEPLLYAVMVALAYLERGESDAFIYFQF